jgi:hypothetical protein
VISMIALLILVHVGSPYADREPSALRTKGHTDA